MDKRTQIPWQYVPILITLGLAGAVAALGPKDMKKQAEPDLVMKKDIDLGIILDTTSPIQLALPVTNQSSRLITIHDVAKDCSCTSVKIDKVKLAPGETATLRVVANLAGKTNFYEGNLIVESDAWEKVDQIHIHGQITGQIRIRPERVTLLMGDRAAPGSFSVFCDDQNGQWRYAGFVADDPDLAVQLHARETSLTTSVYDGTIDISSAAARKKYADFQTSLVTLTFVNDKLGRHFDLKYGVDIAVRRAVTVDPPQVMFLGNGAEQRRTILVQSAQSLRLDTARCSSPSIKAVIDRVDGNATKIDLTYLPSQAQKDDAKTQTCQLLSDGKTIGSVAINIVGIP